jgi:hypothetical protein
MFEKLTIAQIYQFIVLFILVSFAILELGFGVSINQTILGALIGLAVGITGDTIGIDKK